MGMYLEPPSLYNRPSRQAEREVAIAWQLIDDATRDGVNWPNLKLNLIHALDRHINQLHAEKLMWIKILNTSLGLE